MPAYTQLATLHTNHGDITLGLFGDHAPKTVKNFLDLAAKDFYNGVIFHRVISEFMIQGGDPTGTGTGGPGYTFNDEIHPELSFNTTHQLAMANAGSRRNPATGEVEGTNGSQFFVTLIPTGWLTGKHTIFGEVADDASKKVVDEIGALKTGAADRPVSDVVIESVSVTDA